jgi:DNA repair exonuclease SbcCD ATPase subunit
MAHKRPKKTTNELLEDLIWQNAVQVYFLKVIAEGIENMANIDEVLAAVSAIEGNTANVERVLSEVNTQITALQAQVADLQAQIEAGTAITAEQAQGILDRLNAADAAMDTLTGNTPPTE